MRNAISIDTSDVNEVGLQKVNSNILLIAKRQILKSPDYKKSRGKTCAV